jgi:predicted esterase YcpF (UPF0227 family)
MIIAYLHGYSSYFNEENPKVKELLKLGRVVGIDIDYNADCHTTIDRAIEFCMKENVDLVVGCSMGGWLASHVGAALGIPFVALNPAVYPSVSLSKYLDIPDGQLDYGGYPMRPIGVTVLSNYIEFNMQGSGLILLETGDKVFDYRFTKSKLDKYYKVVVVEGGSHQFDSLEDQLDEIENFVELSGIVYGVEI